MSLQLEKYMKSKAQVEECEEARAAAYAYGIDIACIEEEALESQPTLHLAASESAKRSEAMAPRLNVHIVVEA